MAGYCQPPVATGWALPAFLNMCWAPLFFHYRKLKAAVVLNAALVMTLIAALPSFAEAGAALLLTPYLGWLDGKRVYRKRRVHSVALN